MPTLHDHTPCPDCLPNQVRNRPGSVRSIGYHPPAMHAGGRDIWSIGRQGNWHLPPGPVPATLSAGVLAPSRTSEQACFT